LVVCAQQVSPSDPQTHQWRQQQPRRHTTGSTSQSLPCWRLMQHTRRGNKGGLTLFKISTPSGITMVHLIEKELLYQERGFRAATTRMNAGQFMGVGGYLEHFGTIDPQTNYGWGSDIWSGIGKLLDKYTHADKLCGQLFLGWFIIPAPRTMLDCIPKVTGRQARGSSLPSSRLISTSPLQIFPWHACTSCLREVRLGLSTGTG
jgi:hypothetical protein